MLEDVCGSKVQFAAAEGEGGLPTGSPALFDAALFNAMLSAKAAAATCLLALRRESKAELEGVEDEGGAEVLNFDADDADIEDMSV